MVREQEWVKETLELIEELEKKKQSLNEEYERLTNELMDMEQHIKSWHELVRVYMKKHNISSMAESENINLGGSGKSYPDMLKEIAKLSNGILNVSKAVDILFNAKMGSDKKAIAHNVSNSLARYPQNFVRIGRGQYRYTDNVQIDKREVVVVHPNKKRTQERSGIREAVKAIKELHPEWNNRQIEDALVHSGFDFKGKRSINAINMALASLVYLENSKKRLPEGKMTLSIGIPSVQGVKEVIQQLPGLSG